MKIEVNFEKKHLVILSALLSVLALGIAVAYNTNNPSNFGHTAGEVNIVIDGQTMSLQQAIDMDKLVSQSENTQNVQTSSNSGWLDISDQELYSGSCGGNVVNLTMPTACSGAIAAEFNYNANNCNVTEMLPYTSKTINSAGQRYHAGRTLLYLTNNIQLNGNFTLQSYSNENKFFIRPSMSVSDGHSLTVKITRCYL